MPSAVTPELEPLPRWKRPGKTNEELEWAEIKVIDLSIFDEPGGKQKLAEDLRDAVRTVHKRQLLSLMDQRFIKQDSSAL